MSLSAMASPRTLSSAAQTPTTAEVPQQLVADKPEAAVAQVNVTPTQAPAATEATPAASSPAPTSSNALDQLNRYSNEGKVNNSIAQVTSVSHIWLTAPGQSDDNDDVVIGTLRTTFTF